jgi:ADP-heptose:LPS heptosyltransferase
MKIKISENTNNKNKPKPIIKAAKNLSSILFKREYRLGDVIMITPVIKYFSAQGIEVYAHTSKEYHPIFNFCDFPVHICKTKSEATYDKIFKLDRVYSNNRKTITKIDMFFSMCGVDPSELSKLEKMPVLKCSEKHIAMAKNMFNKYNLNKNKNCIISTDSYNIKSPRTMSINKLYHIIENNENINFIVIGKKSVELNINYKNLYNFTGNFPDIEDLFSIINYSDYVITVDTGIMHIAGAFGKKTLSIFGPTNPMFLSSPYNNMISIYSNRKCSPCWEKGCANRCLEEINQENISKCFDELKDNNIEYKIYDFELNGLNV